MHFGSMQTPRYLAAGFVFCATLAACGGGGGGGSTGGGGLPSTPTPSPTSSSTANIATGSGILVDHETGAALAGIKVGLAPNTGGATPNPQGTTAADGSFKIQATPGTYLLVIGNDVYPDPNNRPTIHDMVTLSAGANALTAPNIGPAPGATPNAIEQSGKFRLTTLTSAEQACIAYENTTRTSKGLRSVVSDEWLTEDNRGYWTVATSTGSFPAYPGILVNYNAGDGNGADCKDMIGTGFALNEWPSWSQTIWYAGASGGTHNVATSEGMVDPRSAPYPTPTPSHIWP